MNQQIEQPLAPQEEAVPTEPVQKQPQESAVSDEYKSFFTALLKHCEDEDITVHTALVARVRRLQLLFDNITEMFWDGVASDWHIPAFDDYQAGEDEYIDRIVNYYRPHAESIIAALSVNPPNTLFFPRNADNGDDIETAKNYSNAAKLLQKHNKAALLFIKVITKLFNAGTVFAYTYHKKDKQYGYYHKEVDNFVQQPAVSYDCSQCGYESDTPEQSCPECGSPLTPTNKTETVNDPQTVKMEKGTCVIDIYDPMNVKIPFYAKNQEQVGYLLLKFDSSTAMLRDIYCSDTETELPLVDWIESSNADTGPDTWTRYPTIYRGAQPEGTSVVKLAWFKPFQFMAIASQAQDKLDIVRQLKSQYPDGCYVVFINDKPVEIYAENMDDHWTISIDPKANGIHGEPLGTNLAVVHEISAQIDELVLQTMEHGISELFVASDIIDWDKYKNSEAKPGSVVPVKKNTGKSIGENFYESKTSTLSPEIGSIQNKYQNLAEFVCGDFPNISGAPTEGGSETATAFSKSQTQALQRLGTSWKIASFFWSDVIQKATKEFMSYLDYDDSYSDKSSGGLSNVNVSPDKNMGDISHCEPEFSEQLPVGWSQLQQLVTSLIQLKNPMVDSVLGHPQNFEFMKKVVGTNEVYFPGESDRNKQYREIQLLIEQQPVPMQMSPSGWGPSIMPEEFDKHEIEMEICAIWLNSFDGQKAKGDNPGGYQNVVMHWKAHQLMMINTQGPPPDDKSAKTPNKEQNNAQ